ncbi:hypothetical protein AALB53_08225 [Lachnospiraceae bacterium 47-T17]
MAVQSMNTEIAGKLNNVTSFLRDDTFVKLRQGSEAAIECAKKTGSEKFIKEAEAHYDAAMNLTKFFESLCECCDKYAEQLVKLDAAL